MKPTLWAFLIAVTVSAGCQDSPSPAPAAPSPSLSESSHVVEPPPLDPRPNLGPNENSLAVARAKMEVEAGRPMRLVAVPRPIPAALAARYRAYQDELARRQLVGMTDEASRTEAAALKAKMISEAATAEVLE